MSLVFLLGGARSGKSALAVELAREWRGPVAILATAETKDAEMKERIRLHRVTRPKGWQTIEEPVALQAALGSVADDRALIIDCLSLWVANALERGAADCDVEAEARGSATIAATRNALTIAVSNEVGLGVVPVNALARRYRDVLGRVNAAWAHAADDAALVVAGRLLRLEASSVLGG